MLHVAFCCMNSGQASRRRRVQSVRLTTKFAGSMSLSAQVPGHPEVAYEFPAQSPVRTSQWLRSRS